MNIITSRPQTINFTYIVKIFFAMIFAAVCFLSIKATADLVDEFDIFPIWFIPSFGFVVFVLNAICFYLLLQIWKIESNPKLLSGKQSLFLWLLMSLSFICTTAVHSFHPFRLNTPSILPSVDAIMKINYGVAILGFLVSVALAGIYIFTKMKSPAMIGLMTMALFILIPNDNCSNPFNYWWIETIGASPLMYAPNLYAALFVTCGLYGIHSRIVTLLVMCVCGGCLILGIGHQLRIIW